ncbi:MAG: hypothetical protein ACQERS_10670 [Bacteroidota bacterium]
MKNEDLRNVIPCGDLQGAGSREQGECVKRRKGEKEKRRCVINNNLETFSLQHIMGRDKR